MKRFCFLLLSALFFTAVVSAQSAEDFKTKPHPNGEGTVIRAYKGKATAITIPSEIDNLPVVAIDKKAFGGNKKITEVVIPNTVKEIGESAFKGCSSLAVVTLAASIKKIGAGAFHSCTSLSTVTVPDGISEITFEASSSHDDVFQDCPLSPESRLRLRNLGYDDPLLLDEEESIPFNQLDEKPKFMGGDLNNFTRWVSSKIDYPRMALENDVQGAVHLSFDIRRDGSIANIKVVRSVSPKLDREAVRVVSQSPKWTPGRYQGKAVKVSWQFHVSFGLGRDKH